MYLSRIFQPQGAVVNVQTIRYRYHSLIKHDPPAGMALELDGRGNPTHAAAPLPGPDTIADDIVRRRIDFDTSRLFVWKRQYPLKGVGNVGVQRCHSNGDQSAGHKHLTGPEGGYGAATGKYGPLWFEPARYPTIRRR